MVTTEADGTRLISLLSDAYGIQVDNLEPGERGTVAETWVVASPVGRFFVKSVPVGRYSTLLGRAVPIQARLWDAGYIQMNRPIATTSGTLTVEMGTHILVVYDCIDGVATNDYPFEPYVDLLSTLHQTKVAVDDQIETFDIDSAARAESVVKAALARRDRDPLVDAVRAALERLGPSLERDIAEAHRTRLALAARPNLAMVITHNDAAGNVMIRTDGRLCLVDWDELLLAPPERDTWRHLVDPVRAAAFLTCYRRTVPDHEPDVDAVRHYLLTWYFEEIEGLISPIVEPGTTPKVRARYWRWFQGSVPPLHEALRRLEQGDRPWLDHPAGPLGQEAPARVPQWPP